jgi:uncharacterized membrane protein YeiH
MSPFPGPTEELELDVVELPEHAGRGLLASPTRWLKRYETQCSDPDLKARERGKSEELLTRWPSLGSAEGLFRALDWIGTLSFAVTGSALAGEFSMDLLGCIIVGSITAIGGGTIRDVLLGTSPVFWVEEWEYLVICIISSFFGFLFWEEARREYSTHFVLDTIGLGMFTCVGAQTAIRKKYRAPVVVWSALINACGGGVIRDVLVGRPVRILHNSESYRSLYGACAVFGGMAYWSAYRIVKATVRTRVLCGFVATAFLRWYGWMHRVAMPSPRARGVPWLPQFR